MKVLVVGAAGKTGSLVVENAISAGHSVSAFVHDRNSYKGPAQQVFAGSATDTDAMHAAVKGHDAVIDTIGGKTPYKTTTLERSTAQAIIGAMRSSGAHRLIVTSMLGVGDSSNNAPLFLRLLVATFLRGADRDKTAMENMVRNSNLDWTIVRPAILVDQPARGNLKIFPAGSSEKAKKVSRADVAAFLVEQLSSDASLNQSVAIGS